MRNVKLGTLFTFGAIAVASALVGSSAYASKGPVVDARVMRALATGVHGPRSLRQGPLQPGTAPVMIVLAAPATPETLERLRGSGARLQQLDGRTLFYRQIVPAIVDAPALQALLAMPDVARVAAAPASGPAPLDHSGALIGLDGARGSRPAMDRLTGEGVVVADLDANADVFHPQFFRADAGYFDWIDVDGTGTFDPSKDAIDLDRDGKAGAGETAKLLRAETLNLFWGEKVPARPSGFDPAIDWLYLDDNDNGERDYGSANGFDDDTPAFGEPLFVPDDLNRNGTLDVGERVIRLGTSKFSKVYVHIEYYAEVDRVYERGVDLSTHQPDFTGYLSGYSDALHGSSVLSIVAADVPLAGRRWVGVAPDADLLLGFEIASEEGKALTWALAEQPDVMLHEVAAWVGDPVDGSDVYSLAVDTSVTGDDVAHICPTGNLGGVRKHAEVQLSVGQSKTLALDIPDFGASGPTYYVDVSLNFVGAEPPSVVLREPGGLPHELMVADGYEPLSTGVWAYIARYTSARDTHFVDVLLYTDTATKPIAVGAWQVEVEGHGQTASTLHAFVMDDISGWGVGAAWDEAIASDAHTVGIPSVADSCIAVGAHTGHASTASEPWFSPPEGPLEIRLLSGRGPRIDGEQKPDVVAPDNPWAAAPADKSLSGTTMPHGAVWPFGGTSGAAPHVTGVAALLAQAGVRGLGARNAIRAGAVADGKTGPIPNTEYGWGRLSAAGALGAETHGEAPTVSLSAVPSVASLGQAVNLIVSADDADGPADALEAKWDDDYDGTWDEPYGPAAARTVSHASTGRYPYKVRVRDGEGRFAEAVVWVTIQDEPIPSPDGGADAGDGDTDGGLWGRPTSGSSSSDDGCGCRAAGTSRGGPLALCLIALVAVVAKRRSRRRG